VVGATTNPDHLEEPHAWQPGEGGSLWCAAYAGGVEIRWLGQVEYDEAWALQQQLHTDVVAGVQDDVVLLLEHESVYTAGKRTEAWERPTDGSRVVDVDRGGKITWHGPGQVTGYPIVRLADPVDVVAYVRRLEQVLIDVCAELGLETGRVEGRSGVWTPDGARKVAAIGIRVARGVTMHGFALNCDNSLAPYDAIVACGIRDATVTTLAQELGRDVPVAEVLPLLEKHLPVLQQEIAAL
jgi:lipoyl(octanoyl) transferase